MNKIVDEVVRQVTDKMDEHMDYMTSRITGEVANVQNKILQEVTTQSVGDHIANNHINDVAWAIEVDDIAREIDADDVAMYIDLSDLAHNIRMSNLADYIDYSQVTDNLDYSQISVTDALEDLKDNVMMDVEQLIEETVNSLDIVRG